MEHMFLEGQGVALGMFRFTIPVTVILAATFAFILLNPYTDHLNLKVFGLLQLDYKRQAQAN